MIEQVKSKITDAFQHFNKKYGIPMNDVRIKITKSNGSLNFVVMNKKADLAATDLKEIVGSATMLLAGNAIRTSLHRSVEQVINESGLSEESANIRFHPASDYSPKAHLFDGGKAIKNIEIEKLLN